MKRVLVLGLSLLSSLAGAQGAKNFASMKLGPKPVSLLCGRLTASVPESAEKKSISRSVNAPAEDETRQMRYIADADKARLVLVADELMAKAGTTLLETVKQGFAGPTPPTITEVTLGTMKGVLVAPPKIAADREANLVRALYTTLGDGTVQMLTYYANAEAAKDAGVGKLAESSLMSVRPGKRALKMDAGVRKLGYAATKSLAVTLPAGFMVTHQKGEDFDVWQVQKLVAFGSEMAVLGVYVGGKPAPASAKAKNVKSEKVKLLGKEGEWKTWQPNPKTWSGEVVAELPGEKDLKVHAFTQATSAALGAELVGVLKTLKVVEEAGDAAVKCE